MPEEPQNNGDILDEAMNRGPLSADEAMRRANILIYNDLVETYERKMSHLQMYQNGHPETRQVIAMAADMINDMASEILIELEAAAREKMEN